MINISTIIIVCLLRDSENKSENYIEEYFLWSFVAFKVRWIFDCYLFSSVIAQLVRKLANAIENVF